MVNVNILYDNHATMSGYESYPSDWDRRRRYVYKRDNYQCQRCGVTGGPRGNHQLHAHHRVPVNEGGSHDTRNLVTVCHSCHEKIHGHRIPTDSNTSNQRESIRSSRSKRTGSANEPEPMEIPTDSLLSILVFFLLIFPLSAVLNEGGIVAAGFIAIGYKLYRKSHLTLRG
jgi:hypothetical protein